LPKPVANFFPQSRRGWGHGREALAVHPAAVEAFERQVGPAVIHDSGERGWRWRHQGDVPDGEKVVG
jgi:hypothetical protein